MRFKVNGGRAVTHTRYGYQQISEVESQHEIDLQEGYGSVYMPAELVKKYGKNRSKWSWLLSLATQAHHQPVRPNIESHYQLYIPGLGYPHRKFSELFKFLECRQIKKGHEYY